MHRLLIVLLLVLAGCASQPEDDNRLAEQLYESASSALERGDYETAISEYEALEARFPFGVYAEQAQLDVIYAYYKFEEPDSAIAAAERFIRLNPRHPKVAYAWYMKGLVEQERGSTTITRLFGLDRSLRDPEPLERAFETFQTLVERFPESAYVADARARMKTLRETLARHEIAVADFYAERDAWLAVAKRAIRTLTRYPDSAAESDALSLLARAYGELQTPEMQAEIRRILEMNGIDPDAPAGAG